MTPASKSYLELSIEGFKLAGRQPLAAKYGSILLVTKRPLLGEGGL